MRALRTAGVFLALPLLVAAAGCRSNDSDGSAVQPVPSEPATAAPTTTSVSPVGGGSTGGGAAGGAEPMPGPSGTTPPPSSTVCWTSELGAATANSEGAAGTVYQELTLTNTSNRVCTVRGFPGVSFVDAQGGQLGAAADRSGPAGASVTLAPGERAVATLGVTQPGVLPGCDTGQTAQPADLLVYPPDNRDPLRVPAGTGSAACVDPAVHQLSVTTLEKS